MLSVRLSRGRLGVAAKPMEFLGPALFQAWTGVCNRSGLRWDKDEKASVGAIDRISDLVAEVKAIGGVVRIDRDLGDAVMHAAEVVQRAEQEALERLAACEASLKERGLSLYPFQRDGVLWLASRRFGLLGDTMGLGKTVQALLALPANAPAMVVCPAGVKGNWCREALRWRPDLAVTIVGSFSSAETARLEREGIRVLKRQQLRWPNFGELIVLNYDILPKQPDDPKESAAASLGSAPKGIVLIADEAHALKNRQSLRAKRWSAVKKSVALGSGRIWLMTGTPLLNRPPELWNVLGSANLNIEFGTWKSYCEAFDARKGAWGGTSWGEARPIVAKVLSRVMLRREREKVLPELPEKRWEVRSAFVGKASLEACDRVARLWKEAGIDLDVIEEEVKKSPETAEKAIAKLAKIGFSEISAARAELAKAKLPAVLELVEEYESQEEPLIVASAHRFCVDEIGSRKGWAKITGDESSEERTEVVRRFQAGELKGVALTIRAGGVGVTLTKASNMVFIDLDWTPGMNSQTEDRICRIGQTRGCLYTILVASHPVDERVASLLVGKKKLFDSTVVAASNHDPIPLRSEGLLKVAALVREATEAHEKEMAAQQTPPRATPVKDGSPALSTARRGPASEEESRAIQALCAVAAMDRDRAQEINGVGFNKLDGAFGHSLVQQWLQRHELSDKQWGFVRGLANKYRKQVSA